MPPNSGKPTKSQIIALFCFIEGISIFLKNKQRKIQQIEGQFAGTPHKQLRENSRIFSLWTTKCLKSQMKRIEMLWGIWNKIWAQKQSTIDLELSHRPLMSLSFASVFQIIKLIFVDLLSKSEICWCKNSHFPNFQKFLELELLFQMTSFHRENVQFWWLTRRWIAENLNFLTHCSTLSQRWFPLIYSRKKLDNPLNTL